MIEDIGDIEAGNVAVLTAPPGLTVVVVIDAVPGASNASARAICGETAGPNVAIAAEQPMATLRTTTDTRRIDIAIASLKV